LRTCREKGFASEGKGLIHRKKGGEKIKLNRPEEKETERLPKKKKSRPRECVYSKEERCKNFPSYCREQKDGPDLRKKKRGDPLSADSQKRLPGALTESLVSSLERKDLRSQKKKKVLGFLCAIRHESAGKKKKKRRTQCR